MAIKDLKEAAGKKVEAKKAAAGKPAQKKERFSFIRYFREMFGEIKKLTWLSGKELLSHTVAVFVFVVAMAALIYVLDLGFSSGMKALESIHIG